MTYQGNPPMNQFASVGPATNYSGPQTTPPGLPAIYVKANELFEQTDHLAKTIDELAQQLSGIMVIDPPVACSGGIAPQSPLKSEHLMRLEDISSRVHGSILRIRNIMSRLEV